uniref:HNH endonuclease n=1 Tax=Rhizobium phage LG08 TaxID=3129229 RepID=A0AAU8HY95_9CAUD
MSSKIVTKSRVLNRFGRVEGFDHCVYITYYFGDKLPPFYIGKGIISRIEENGYRGSPSLNGFKEELKENPHLFAIKVMNIFKTDREAREEETLVQKHFSVHKSDLFINRAIYDGKCYYNPKGIKASEETKKRISSSLTGLKQSEDTKRKRSASMRGKNKGRKLGPVSSETKMKISNKNRGKGKKSFMLISPDGSIFKVEGLKDFAKENNLTPSALSSVVSRKRDNHKGWKLYL